MQWFNYPDDAKAEPNKYEAKAIIVKPTSTSLTMLIWSSFFKIAISWYTLSRGAAGLAWSPDAVFDPLGGGRPNKKIALIYST